MALQITSIKDFPSAQAEEIQKHLKELDSQDKLLDYFKEQYQDLGKYNSLANYILKNLEKDGKKLYLEWTGIETFDDKHTIKRTGVKLNEVSYGNSYRYFLWKCITCKYEWVAVIADRTSKKRGCKACSRKICIQGVNDLETFCKKNSEFSKLLTEFMGEDIKGNKILPSEISKASNKDVWWKCSNPGCEHKWHSIVANITYKNLGCTECVKKRRAEAAHLQGEPLLNWCNANGKYGKQLKEEFIGLDEDNKPIALGDISRGSKQKIYWKCSKCHKIWLAKPNSRTSKDKSGCPYCATYMFTSFPEQYIYHSLLQLFPNTKNRQKDKLKNYEYDIVIPELNLCIEYSGYSWHVDKLDRDQAKEDHCEENGIQFMQIYGHRGDMIEPDTYTKEKIMYEVLRDKSQHIIQLQQIIKFILEQYSKSALYDKINFTISEQQANKIMNKA